MRIFIAGCARSGTSLTRGLMSSFRDTYTHGHYAYDTEAAEAFFDTLDRPEKNVVIKRVFNSHLTLPYLSPDIGLLYCVRHPLDVLTSSHPQFPQLRYYVSEPRWRAEYGAYGMLRGLQPTRPVFVLRYEDLVTDPDRTQERIAAHFGLEIAQPFSRNADGVSISSGSLEKWRRNAEFRAYFDSFDRPFRDVIERFCREFDYKLPLRYRSSYPEVLRPTTWRDARRELAAPRIARFKKNPIVRPEMLPGDQGRNINGPSLIRAPKWLRGRLGKYYLYFADHKGKHIRLAYADRLSGPWKIHEPGTLQLDQAPTCKDHIASPDVHVDEEAKQIRMYFHGPLREGDGQASFVATSRNGLKFEALPERLSGPYLRMFTMNDIWFGIDQDGGIYRSTDGLTGFERRERGLPFAFDNVTATTPRTVRHLALHRTGDTLHLFYTRRGDAPERIWYGRIALTPDWNDWDLRDEVAILSPKEAWEGANLPVVASEIGVAKGFRNELRDPAIFSQGERTCLLYSVAGEGGIAIADLHWPRWLPSFLR